MEISGLAVPPRQFRKDSTIGIRSNATITLANLPHARCDIDTEGLLIAPGKGYLLSPLEVAASDAPALRWKGVPHLLELDLSRPELTERMIWVWAPNDTGHKNKPDTRRDTLLERLKRGNRRLYVYRRGPYYYRAATEPGFRGWDESGRGLDAESLATWRERGSDARP